MKVVIAGQKWLAAEVLVSCLALGHDVVLAIAPDAGDRLATAAAIAGLPVAIEARRIQRAPACDLLIAAHCHAFITAEARSSATLGAIGYHPSLLPRHRGKDAIEATVRAGDAIAGGSVYLLDDRMDGGPVVAQRHCHVLPGETPSGLWRRALAPLGVELLREAVESAEAGALTGAPQDERVATWAGGGK